MAKRRLPTGIQTFREIRESDCYYVDKTGYALRLFHGGKHFLLSRPRRFGKSLFVDTLKHLFEGDQELFVGLEHGLLRTGDLDGLQTWFRALFAGIPYQWHSRNTIADYEGYYASVFYSFFVGSGAAVTAEDSGSAGRADLAVQTAGRMYLFEFKVFAAAQRGAALQQLRDRKYAAKYRHLGLPIHLVGVEFNAQTRAIEVFESAIA